MQSHSRSAPASYHILISMANPVALREADIQLLVDSSLVKNNAALLACMKSAIEESVNSLKRANSESSKCQLREIKKLKCDEPHCFRKKANEDQFKFNLKLQDIVEDAQSSLEKQKLDKVKDSLEQGETLSKERQKHILLADKSPYGFQTVKEYKKNELVGNSDDEKKIFKAEARAKAQLNQTKQKSSQATMLQNQPPAPVSENRVPAFFSHPGAESNSYD